jgi:protein SCO1/2
MTAGRQAIRGLAAAAAALALALSACQPANPPPPSFLATDITGAAFARDFALTDHDGHARTLADFRGQVVAVFFGYTHCPDVCPTTLADFAAALELLGDQAERVQVIFVTVDPERDTPELLRQFVPAFNPKFLGMYTDAESLKKLAQEYKVVYEKSSVRAPDDYLIDHSAGTYVYDTQGRLRLLMPYGSDAASIAQDLRTLLSES